VSKAFAKSNLGMIIGFFEAWQRYRYSKDQAKQS
jgi:hypothetical protein